MNERNIVLDTNILLEDPSSIYKFGSSDIFLSTSSVGELDRIKKESSERGRNSRKVSRILDTIMENCEFDNNLVKARMGDNLGSIYFVGRRLESDVDSDVIDCATSISKNSFFSRRETVLVTNDVNLRIRAKIESIKSESYSGSRHTFNKESSLTEMKVQGDFIDNFFQNSGAEWNDISNPLRPNCSVVLSSGSSQSALARFYKSEGMLKPLKIPRDGVHGIKPKNKEQSFALDMLLDDDIQLVTLFGKSGTGKSLLAIAAGLHSLERGSHSRLLITRPIIPVGRDIGHLPGTLEEKMAPWMQPIHDNLEVIMNSGGSGIPIGPGEGTKKLVYRAMFDSGKIQIEPITYMRGRSLPMQIILVDEAQNMSQHEMKTLLTRVGEGSKIILTGDPDQIDNPSVDGHTNGISIVAEKFRNREEAGSITLTRGTRSSFAELAADIL
jgi:PhoH-like ATPase